MTPVYMLHVHAHAHAHVCACACKALRTYLLTALYSEQGIIGRLGNASFSVVANTDGIFDIATRTMACRVIAAAAKALLAEAVDLHCEP